MDATETKAALEGLAEKLATIELTEDEDVLLAAIVARAAGPDPEVEGFLLTDDGTLVLFKDPNRVGDVAPKLARGLGLDPSSVWTDMRPLS